MTVDEAPTPEQASAPDLVETTIRLGRLLESELEEVLAAHRLSLRSYFVLAALAQAPDRTLTQKRLVSAAGRTSGTTSVRLGRLERAGMIERAKDDDDARAVRVSLTDRGAALLDRARATYEQRAGQLTAPLGDKLAAVDGALTGWLAFFDPAERVAPRLGVVVAPAAVANRMRRMVGLDATQGLLVLGVEPGSPAAGSELRRGDLIQTLGGEAIHSTGDLERAIARASATATVGLLRGTDTLDTTVKLG